MSTATVVRENIRYSVILVTMVCSECQCPYAIPADLDERARNNSKVTFYCPHGHSQHYTKSELDRTKEQLAAAERQRDNARAAYDRERDRAASAERSASAYKGQATRLRRRAANGVCPCCKRTFQQLARHMASQHPDFEQAALEAGDSG